MPGMPGAMPPFAAAAAGPKESPWERGLKMSKRIREEVRRNEKSDEDSDDSHPNSKVFTGDIISEYYKDITCVFNFDRLVQLG